MHRLMSSIVAACLLLAGACQVVHSREPMGTQPHAIDEEDWSGSWVLGSGGTATIEVLDAEQGLLEIGYVKEDRDGLEAHVMRCKLLEFDGVVFANIQDFERRHLYVWACVKRDDEQVILWVADGERVAESISAGRLPGVDSGDGNAILDALDEQQLDQLLSWENGLMHWDTPLAMIRIAR